MNRKDIIWLCVFMSGGIHDLSFIPLVLPDNRYLSKPVILLSLIVYFIKGSQLIKGSFLRKSVTTALVFALIGDILLMFPSFFLYGLGAFLMTYICYVVAFILAQRLLLNVSSFNFIRLFIYNLPIYLVAAFLYFLIHRQLGSVKAPVIIYLCAMVMLVTTARLRFKNTNESSFWQVLIGSVLFFISHGIFLIDLFFQPIAEVEILIMGTYLLAQLLIVMGLRSHFLDVLIKVGRAKKGEDNP